MKKIMVELLENSNSVNLITEVNGRKSERLISVEDFIESLKTSAVKEGKNDFKAIINPLHKEVNNIQLIQTKQTGKNSYYYILHCKKKNTPFPLFNRFYENVGIPNMLFAVYVVNNKVSRLNIVTVKDSVIDEKSKIYYYPFSNVSRAKGDVCLGNNNINKYAITQRDNLYKIPDLFFSMPNNGHSFDTTKNSMAYEYEQMIKLLDNSEFNNDWLVENSDITTYKEWVEKL